MSVCVSSSIHSSITMLSLVCGLILFVLTYKDSDSRKFPGRMTHWGKRWLVRGNPLKRCMVMFFNPSDVCFSLVSKLFLCVELALFLFDCYTNAFICFFSVWLLYQCFYFSVQVTVMARMRKELVNPIKELRRVIHLKTRSVLFS